MKKLLIILFLFISSLVSAQTGWQFTDPNVQGKITFENGYQLYDSADNGLKLTGSLFLSGTRIVLGANMEIRDSSGYSIFNKTPIFRNALPWITVDDIKDSAITLAKIKKGQITTEWLAQGLKDSIFGNASVGEISRSINDVNTRYSLLFDAKGDFKPGVFSESILAYDTTTNKVKLDTSKFAKGLKLTGDRLDINIPGLKDTLGAYYQKETIFLTWADTATHFPTVSKFMSTIGHNPDSIGYVMPRKGVVKSVTVITAAGVRTKVSGGTLSVDVNVGLGIYIYITTDGGFTDYDAIQLSLNGAVDPIFYPDGEVQQVYTTFTTGTNKVIVEVELEPI